MDLRVQSVSFQARPRAAKFINAAAQTVILEKILPLDVLRMTDIVAAMNGAENPHYLAIALNKPTEEGQIRILQLGDFYAALKTINTKGKPGQHDTIEANLGHLDIEI